MEKLKWFNHPKIYEINTWPWLHFLSEKYNEKITLQNIPKEVFNKEFQYFDAIWLMGVWQRSLKSEEIGINHLDLQGEFKKALSDYTSGDVVGSPYSVFDYRVDKHLGGLEGLESFRSQLKEKDIHLLLDYVPNHLAIDNIWLHEKKDMFIQGTKDEFMKMPYYFFWVEDMIFAHGRDPYFPPWTDTVQINAFSEIARENAVKTLLSIADMCDGVRCDMAMLVTNETFDRTWGWKAKDRPEKEFWDVVIPKVRDKHKDFIFIAEVYWDKEWQLQQQGFNFCYDKRLYDRMLHENPEAIKAHLLAEWDYQSKLLRFIENHDERRVREAFGDWKSRVAATIILTLPGARLIHEGQMRGYKTKTPVQLGRRTAEHENPGIKLYYEKLFEIIPDSDLMSGKWGLCEIRSVGNNSFKNLIAYQWWTSEKRQLTVVNFSPRPAQGHIIIDDIEFGTKNWTFNDVLNEKTYTYNGEDLSAHGLFVGLAPWRAHVFNVGNGD